MNKNQNFIQFIPADQQPSRHQITKKIWGKRKTTSRPKFDSGRERERERAWWGCRGPWLGQWVREIEDEWWQWDSKSEATARSRAAARSWARGWGGGEIVRWDGERSRPWVAEVRSRRKWDCEVRNRESERSRPRCRRWDCEKPEVRMWEREWVTKRQSEKGRSGVRTKEGRLKKKKKRVLG